MSNNKRGKSMSSHNLSTYSGRLAWAIEQTGRSMRSIAIEVGMAPASLEYLVKHTGKTRPSKYNARIAAVVGVRADWLRARDGEAYEEGQGPKDESGAIAPGRTIDDGTAEDVALTDMCIAAIEYVSGKLDRVITPRQSIRMYRLLYSTFYPKRASANVQSMVEWIKNAREGLSL